MPGSFFVWSKRLAKKKTGRPSKFDPAFCDLARKLCLLGATNDDLAEALKVDVATIERWIASNAEFRGAVKGAKEELDAKVVRRLFERATGYSHPDVHISNYQGAITQTAITKHYPPDTTASIFWLKNRRPADWRDRIEHTGKDGKDLMPAPDMLEVARRLGHILASATQP